MNTNSRVLQKCKNKISQAYKPEKNKHLGIDIIGDNGAKNNTGLLDYITAHSQGTVVACVNNITGYKAGSYGNYVKIKHNNGMYTLYAHLKYNTVTVSVDTKVLQGEVIGYMGNTGNSYGAHLHFEVRDTNDKKINPTPYINADLPNNGTSNSNSGTNNTDTGTKEPVIETNDISDKDLLLLVKRTIRGDFGNGNKRKEKLGVYYSEVMKQVNLNVKNKTTRWDSVRLY